MPTCKELESHYFCLYNKKERGWKSMAFLESLIIQDVLSVFNFFCCSNNCPTIFSFWGICLNFFFLPWFLSTILTLLSTLGKKQINLSPPLHEYTLSLHLECIQTCPLWCLEWQVRSSQVHFYLCRRDGTAFFSYDSHSKATLDSSLITSLMSGYVIFP